MADNKNVRYLNPIAIDTKSERYCRFREKGFKYICLLYTSDAADE